MILFNFHWVQKYNNIFSNNNIAVFQKKSSPDLRLLALFTCFEIIHAVRYVLHYFLYAILTIFLYIDYIQIYIPPKTPSLRNVCTTVVSIVVVRRASTYKKSGNFVGLTYCCYIFVRAFLHFLWGRRERNGSRKEYIFWQKKNPITHPFWFTGVFFIWGKNCTKIRIFLKYLKNTSLTLMLLNTN